MEIKPKHLSRRHAALSLLLPLHRARSPCAACSRRPGPGRSWQSGLCQGGQQQAGRQPRPPYGSRRTHEHARGSSRAGKKDTAAEIYLLGVISYSLRSIYYHKLKLPYSFILNEFSHRISKRALPPVSSHLSNNAMQIFCYISMKYVENYYPVHYLSISREAPVPATGRLSLIPPPAKGG